MAAKSKKTASHSSKEEEADVLSADEEAALDGISASPETVSKEAEAQASEAEAAPIDADEPPAVMRGQFDGVLTETDLRAYNKEVEGKAPKTVARDPLKDLPESIRDDVRQRMNARLNFNDAVAAAKAQKAHDDAEAAKEKAQPSEQTKTQRRRGPAEAQQQKADQTS